MDSGWPGTGQRLAWHCLGEELAWLVPDGRAGPSAGVELHRAEWNEWSVLQIDVHSLRRLAGCCDAVLCAMELALVLAQFRHAVDLAGRFMNYAQHHAWQGLERLVGSDMPHLAGAGLGVGVVVRVRPTRPWRSWPEAGKRP